MSSEFGNYVLAKTASKVFGESKTFFDELASAKKSPVYINGKFEGYICTAKNGELKDISVKEILRHAKRLGTSVLIAKQVAKKL